MTTNETKKAFRHAEVDGIVVAKPTAADVEALQVGDLALNVFGKWAPVTRIFARGRNVRGEAYVCYYTRLDASGDVSGSAVAGEIIATIPSTARWNTTSQTPDPWKN